MGERRVDERPARSEVLEPSGSGATSALDSPSSAAEAPPVLAPRSRLVSRRRVWAARVVALVADGLQFALLPLVLGGAASPVDDAIDVVTAAVLTGLVGFRWAFLPTFIAELVPFVDLAPTWTIAVFVSTRQSDEKKA